MTQAQKEKFSKKLLNLSKKGVLKWEDATPRNVNGALPTLKARVGTNEIEITITRMTSYDLFTVKINGYELYVTDTSARLGGATDLVTMFESWKTPPVAIEKVVNDILNM